MAKSRSEEPKSKASGNSRRREISSSSRMRREEVESLRNDRRFLDMTLGELYKGEYGLMDVLQQEYEDLEAELKDKGGNQAGC